MDKKLQITAWSCLPKEFKDEVKKRYNDVLFTDYDSGYRDALAYLFGGYNLTFDAEGGDEMLYVSRKKLQYFYEKLRKVGENNAAFALQSLFGSKCLPDEKVSDSTPLVEPKPAEPKFKVGDMVKYRLDGKRYEVMGKTGKYHYSLNGYDKDVLESDLAPYTEPKEESRNLSQETANCDKQFDNVLKDGFSKERRLNIAAMAMQGILCNKEIFNKALQAGEETLAGDDISYRAVAKASFAFADALIVESNLPIN